MRIDIKLNSQILAILDVKLFDTVLTKKAKETFSGILTWYFNNILLRHPGVTSASRYATISWKYCNNFSC